jgi:excisionase family DNA binding protein
VDLLGLTVWRGDPACNLCPSLLDATFRSAHLLVMETNATLSGLEPLIGIEELAEYLGVPIKTLYKWRQEGTGPCSVRVGRHVRYFVSDVPSHH